MISSEVEQVWCQVVHRRPRSEGLLKHTCYFLHLQSQSCSNPSEVEAKMTSTPPYWRYISVTDRRGAQKVQSLLQSDEVRKGLVCPCDQSMTPHLMNEEKEIQPKQITNPSNHLKSAIERKKKICNNIFTLLKFIFIKVMEECSGGVNYDKLSKFNFIFF